MSRPRRAIIVMSGLGALIVSTLGLLFSGPLFTFEPGEAASTWIGLPVDKLEDLEAYLAKSEAAVLGLKPQLAKGVVWANPGAKVKSKYSIVYIHGFSASRADTAPLANEVARELGANLYYTRLAAHGLQDGEEFARLKAQHLVDDAREALAVGRLLGENVILMGMSTGAALVLHLVNENKDAKDIAALVMLSTNHSPKSKSARYLSGPLGPVLARFALGSHHSFEPINEAHAKLWTPKYRVSGVVAMMDLLSHVREIDLAQIKTPTLTLYTSKDTVVDVDLIRSRHAELGAQVKEIVDLPEATRHELAGDAVAQEATPAARKAIVGFLANVKRSQ